MGKTSAKIILLLFLLPIISYGQKNFYKLAEKAFANEEYYSAIEYYKKSYDECPHDKRAELLFKVGFCYLKISDYKQAEIYFSKCLKAMYPDPIAYYYLAVCEKHLGKYDEAIVEYENYRRQVPGEGKTFITSCENAKQWMNAPTNYVLENEAQINSKYDDWSPLYCARYPGLYFISGRPSSHGSDIDKNSGEYTPQVFYSERDSNWKWSYPLSGRDFLKDDIEANSVFYDSLMGVFYFSKQIETKKKGKGSKKEKSFSQHNKPGLAAEMLSFCKTDTGDFNFITPFLIRGENLIAIIFSSDMPGGFGGYDLWMTIWNSQKKIWDAPKNLGPNVNTSYNEKCPYIKKDMSLYFSSDNDAGMGGYDNYLSRFQGNGWGLPGNLKCPMNSSADDMGIIFDGDKDEGYISSNREGGKGGMDLYEFYLKGK